MDIVTLLLAEARTAGLTVTGDGDRLVIRGPRKAEVLARRLLDEKAAVLAALRPAAEAPGHPASVAVKAVCRCGSTAWRDLGIHGGQSTRRDCRRCGRFICFPIWYGGSSTTIDSNNGV